MKVFLTGASGILGTEIKAELEKDNCEVLGFNSKEINIVDLAEVRQKVKDFRPEIVIHSAAMTNVDLCEDDKNAALQINVIGSHNLSLAASNCNAKIVYISSCGVYGNEQMSPYSEYDSTKPVNFHHFTKLEGENRVKEHNSNHLVVRPGWLFGGTREHRKNFVEARRLEATKNQILKSAVDKFGCPTYTQDLAKQLIVLLKEEIYGTFNIVNEGVASRFDYVSAIIELMNLNNEMVGVNSNEFPRKANMPDNETLKNVNLALRNINQMRNWRDALADYIKTTY